MTKEMNSAYPHITRMQTERDDLEEKLTKLGRYYDNHFSELDARQRNYMAAQMTAMRAYIDILQDRINYDIQKYTGYVDTDMV